MNSDIVKHWNGEERNLPGINCIAFPDGRVVILNCYSFYHPNKKERRFICSPLCDTTIDSIENYCADCWTCVDEWISVDYQGGNIYGGAGAMGHEGFIACTDENDTLLWGMFFENTNPIKSLKIMNRTLVAINEHSELLLEVNLDVLTDLKMIPLVNQ